MKAAALPGRTRGTHGCTNALTRRAREACACFPGGLTRCLIYVCLLVQVHWADAACFAQLP